MNPPSFGFGGSGGFGSGTSPFGAQSQAAQGSPFGTPSGGGIFGSQQPAFGAASQPSFGGSSPFGGGGFGKQSVGSSPFGGATGGFGAPSASPFGQPSSTPAFGGGTTFGGAAPSPAFGASTPAFGAVPSSPFGGTQASSAFGGGGFGASTSATGGFGVSSGTMGSFGSTAGGFGAPTPAAYGGFGASPTSFTGAQAVGTTSVKYQDTVEQDTTGGSLTSLKYHSISAMPAYRNKTFEELRAEDYQAGVKGGSGVGMGTQTPFGAPSTSAPFGAPASSAGFGSGGFGAGSSGFGAQSAPGFGASPAPAFGAATTPFGSSSSSPLGSTGVFGAAKPAFGAASTAGFGASPPAFGTPGQSGFGTASTPAFGASSGGFGMTGGGGMFGATSTPSLGGGPPAFGSTGGLFGTSSTPGFGATSAPSFGASSTPAFGASAGQFGASSAPTFGSTGGAGMFGTTSAPAFSGGSLFGSAPASGGGLFGASSTGQASTPSFGAGGFGVKPAGMFGATPTTTGGLFGGGSTPSFGLGAFGAAAPQPAIASTQPSFGTPGAPSLLQSPQSGMAPAPVYPSSPYGNLPTLQTGVGGYPETASKPAMISSARMTTSLLSPRTIAPVSAMKLRPRGGRASTRTRSPGSPATAFFDVGKRESPVAPKLESPLLRARENPRQLFIRAPPEAAAAALIAATKSPSEKQSPTKSLQDGATSVEGLGEGEDSKIQGDEVQPFSKGSLQDVAKTSTPRRNGVSPLEHSSQRDKTTGMSIAPKLTGVDYFTKPDLDSLEAIAKEDPAALACVENFTVGRRGVGSVRWLEPTDVRGLDLDDLVKFEPREVRVYLDETNKPCVGEGLNKPAEITLFGIYRLDRATGKPLTDDRTVQKLRDKLSKVVQDQTEGKGKMVDYNVRGGIWRFQVEHFSRYGLDEEEEEEEVSLMEEENTHADVAPDSVILDDAKQQGPVLKCFGLPSEDDTQTSSEATSEGADFEFGSGEDEALDGMAAVTRSKLPPPLASSAGLLSHPTSDWVETMPVPATVSSVEPLSGLENGIHHAWRGPGSGKIRWESKRMESSPSSVLPPMGGCVVQRHPLTNGDEASSLFTKSSTRSTNLGLYFGMSFRVGWGPKGKFVTACTLSGSSAAKVTVRRVRTAQFSGIDDPSEETVQEQRLSIHTAFSATKDIPDNDGKCLFPQRVFCCDSYSLHKVCKSYALLLSSVKESEVRVWDLVSVLHGSLSDMHGSSVSDDNGEDEIMATEAGEDMQESSYLENNNTIRDKPERVERLADTYKRRAAFSRWLSRVNSVPTSPKHKGASACLEVFQHLARRDIASAVGHAVQLGDIRLATLLSQVGSRSQVRRDACCQLELWEDHGCIPHIDKDRLRLYRLLAGQVAETLAGTHLDWRGCLGLCLWYAADSPSGLTKTAMETYCHAFKAGYAPPPVSDHLHGEQTVAFPEAMDYHLIRLYSDGVHDSTISPEDAVLLLRPISVTPNQLDYAASWHLATVLSAVGVLDTEKLHAELLATLTVKYLAQAIREDLPTQWQVYIALHHPDNEVRESLVCEVLTRTAPSWSTNVSAVVSTLSAWNVSIWPVHLAQAMLHRSCANDKSELDALLAALGVSKSETAKEIPNEYASVVERAHNLFCTTVAPQLLCAGAHSHIADLLETMLPWSSVVTGWHHGAGVYVAHYRLQEGHPCLSEDQHAEALAASWSLYCNASPWSQDAYAILASALANALSVRAAADTESLTRHSLALRLPALGEVERLGTVQQALSAYATWLSRPHCA